MRRFHSLPQPAMRDRHAERVAQTAGAADPLKIGFIYVGPRGDMGWSWQHELGRLAIEKQFGNKISTTFLENVSEGPDAERSIEQLARTGHQLIYTTSFGFMDATVKVAKKYPEAQVRARHRLQARRQPRHLFRPLLRRPLHPGPDRGQDVEDRHARLHRLVPDPGSDRRHQCHHARRADGQSEHQGEDHLGEFLVRSGQGSRRRQGAARPGRRHPDAAHRQPGGDADRGAARRVRVRPGLRHDQVRAEDAAHRDHQQLDAVLHRARANWRSTTSGRAATCGAGSRPTSCRWRPTPTCRTT